MLKLQVWQNTDCWVLHKMRPVRFGKRLQACGIDGNRLFLIAGPCVIESEAITFDIARTVKDIAMRLSIPVVFKASYDKANRSAHDAFRGPGLLEGLPVLQAIKKELDIPVLSDVHAVDEIEKVADVLDILQIPAFLCRQTDLLVAAAQSSCVVNVKKGQFLAPWDMGSVLNKLEAAGASDILLTERGVSFGYNNLVSDMRAIVIMRKLGYPIVFDATHSVQLPGGMGTSSGGEREYAPFLAHAACAVGCDGLFFEVHQEPNQALCDGQNMVALSDLENVLTKAIAIRKASQ